ncbi:MAG: hypothetical protein BGO51_07265 [Rhodospirillales bacterium 69-11]|nr:MAG: hypothetical protein BGO51_07265 [Rhodospirillales bacterium 69-11]
MFQKAAALAALLLPAACTSGPQHTVETLNTRLRTELAPDAAAGRVVLTPQPDGAQVVFREPPLTPVGSTVLDDRDQYIMASVTEALLDLSLMHVAVAQAPGSPLGRDGARAQAAADYLRTYRVPVIAAQPLPAVTPQVPPGGLLVDIRVQCPTVPTRTAWGLETAYGPAQPACD